MREVRRWAGWAVAAVAAAVMVVGLLPGESAPVSNQARTEALAANLRCPFCSGESIAEAPSQVARDLEAFIGEKVDEGWSDEQIYSFFEARYGEQVRLDPQLDGWGLLLWGVPLGLVAVGIAAIVQRRRPGPLSGGSTRDATPAEVSQ